MSRGKFYVDDFGYLWFGPYDTENGFRYMRFERGQTNELDGVRTLIPGNNRRATGDSSDGALIMRASHPLAAVEGRG